MSEWDELNDEWQDEWEDDLEDDEDVCIMCGQPIPIEGFCCSDECLEAVASDKSLEAEQSQKKGAN